MSKYIYFTFIFLTFQSFYSQCPVGDVYLNSQTDVENYIAAFGTCDVITGNLYIGRANDISGITSIKRIEGSLIISYSDITSVSNFSNLEFVGGDFEIDQSHLIETIEGINKLHTVNGNFLIYGNQRVETINGFDSLETVKGDFGIKENNLMKTIPGFDKLKIVEGLLLLNRNNSLLRIHGFNQLMKIGTEPDILLNEGNLSIEGNNALVEVNGFNSLIEIEKGMFFMDNPSLLKIIGFSSLEKVHYNLNIGGYFSRSLLLNEIPKFNNLSTIGASLEIRNTGLTSINGFNNIKIIGLYTFAGNLDISDNGNLTGITGFQNLEKLEGTLTVAYNPMLNDLSGFLNLVEIQNLILGNNRALTNLIGLDNLFKVGPSGNGIDISNNVSLVDCSVLCNLLSYGIIDGLVIIQDNPSKCSSESQVRSECLPDFDKDGILDDNDLDDDNDGILDTVEQNGDPNRDTDSDGYPDHQDLDSDGDGCFDVIEAGFTDGDDNGTLGSSPDTVDSNGLIVGAPDGYTTPLDADGNNVFDFQEFSILNAGLDGRLEVCTNSILIDLFNSLGGTPDVEGVWSPSLASGTGVFDPSIDNPGIYTYTVINGVCGSSTSQVEVVLNQLSNAGLDSNLLICENNTLVNLFDILGGTPNNGGIWIPSLASGTGIFDPLVDLSGIYTYTVTNGVCGSDTSQVEVIVEQLPNAGLDGSLDICINSILVNLFDNLGGLPDALGVWSPSLASGTGFFNPSIDAPGIYTYTVSNGICGSDTSEVEVVLDQLPNAGLDGSIEICENATPVNLFDSLGGMPDMGGMWSPSLASGTGIFDPSIDVSGIYIYTFTNGVCGSDTSQVEVVVDQLPNAGLDGTLEVCVNSIPLDLFESLGGTPDTGGVWSPSLASGTGVFDPLIDTLGTYNYIITNGVCGSDTSEVIVGITNVTPIQDYVIKTTELNGNNLIEVVINSNLPYEYSLDNVNFQSSNIFSNISGGDYIIYVKEVSGCGILEVPVSILDYPKYFTPNNDGFNDTWKLKGRTNQEYSIYIYDRYGKLLKHLVSFENGWDGTFNGKALPTDDYWFKIVFTNGTIKNGHFTLKR